MSPDFIEFRALTKTFVTDHGGEVAVVDPLDLSIAEGEFVVFVGPSGCGKTTVMRMVSGLELPTGGEVCIEGRRVEGPSRDKGMVFQSYSSFPWLTVLGNIRFGLRYRDDIGARREGAHRPPLSRPRRPDALRRLLRQPDLGRDAPARGDRAGRSRPTPRVLLMDEPFGALDALTRERLQVQLLQLRKTERKTVIFVTHDVDEAVFLADRIIVFSARPARVLSDIRVCDTIPAERTLDSRWSCRRFAPCGRRCSPSSATRSSAPRRRKSPRPWPEGDIVTFDFTGKRVLVTGASHGIGRAVATAFAAAGAELAILSSTADVEAAGAAIAVETGRPVTARICDITDRQAVREVVGGLDRIDVLVNNAGLERVTPIAAEDDDVEATFARIIEINVIGTYYVTREALRRMPDGCSIVITSSIWGKSAAADFAAYVSSKHANIGFMRVLAKELGPRRIRVNAVCPGWVRTRAALRSLGEVAAAAGTGEDEALAGILAAQALPGLMDPEDVASTYLFLASDAARNITGQAVNVDRGEVMA